MAGVRCLADPSAYAWILFRQWLWRRHRGRFGRRWHQPAAGQTTFTASPECQTGNRRSWSFACTGTPRVPISPYLPFLSTGAEAIRQYSSVCAGPHHWWGCDSNCGARASAGKSWIQFLYDWQSKGRWAAGWPAKIIILICYFGLLVLWNSID